LTFELDLRPGHQVFSADNITSEHFVDGGDSMLIFSLDILASQSFDIRPYSTHNARTFVPTSTSSLLLHIVAESKKSLQRTGHLGGYTVHGGGSTHN
jgi:hypothetical protein